MWVWTKVVTVLGYKERNPVTFFLLNSKNSSVTMHNPFRNSKGMPSQFLSGKSSKGNWIFMKYACCSGIFLSIFLLNRYLFEWVWVTQKIFGFAIFTEATISVYIYIYIYVTRQHVMRGFPVNGKSEVLPVLVAGLQAQSLCCSVQ